MQDVEFVVIGAGVMGAATARSLARAGREVVLLEQFEVGHKRGSSHGASRIFRFSYPDPAYVRMAQEALPLWRELEREAGGPLLVTTGGIDIGEAAGGHERALASCGVPHEWLDAAEVARRFPFVSLPRGRTALFQPDAGILAADRAVSAMVRSGVSSGATLRERTRVLRIMPDGDRATVVTAQDGYRARAVVVTAGAWAPGLLAGQGRPIPVRPTRETVGYFLIEDGPPVPTLVEWGPSPRYALPSPGQGIKAGEHHAGPDADPDDPGAISEPSLGRLRAWIRERFPGAEAEPHLAETCLYSNTPDETFILERRGPIVIGSPCSGHGFKFAPLIGKRLARLATG